MHHRYLSANVQGEPKDKFESVGQSVLLAWLTALTCAVIAFVQEAKCSVKRYWLDLTIELQIELNEDVRCKM
jgi:hypothetical protein